MRDKVLTGMLVGIAADAVKLSFNYLAYRLHFTKVVFWQIAASHFLEKGDLFHPLAYVIGGIADLTVAALMGVAFVWLLPYLGQRCLWLKGAGFGLSLWVGLFGILTSHVAQKALPWDPKSVIVTPLSHLVFGLALGVFGKILYPQPSEAGRTS